MFDVGFTELVLLFVIGLLILGPERLPRVASQIGRWVGRARRTANQLRYQLEREVALEEMARTKREHKPRPEEPSGEPEQAGAADTAAAHGRGAEPAESVGDDARAPGEPPTESAPGARKAHEAGAGRTDTERADESTSA